PIKDGERAIGGFYTARTNSVKPIPHAMSASQIDFAEPSYVVEPGKLLDSHPKNLWAYRELFLLLVKRDFVAAYKQTALGPFWFFVQPFLASLAFLVVFSQIARLSTTDLPPLVFYMSGIIVWNFFSNCVSKVAYTFLLNAQVFRKIYFPRLIMPLSQIGTNLLNFIPQLGVLFLLIGFYNLSGRGIALSSWLFALPLTLGLMALLALGLGCLIAAATVKYRDLTIVVGYMLNLWMYGSLVICPRSAVPPNLSWLVTLNPMASFVECYRSSLFGTEHAQGGPLMIAIAITLLLAAVGLACFKRAERTFTDHI
ncbi:MAG TPA: ABC transporter permease, partial [Chthoniobacterales bacterium]|nr:ABC transporter permease [Chthoniobacterales bacterium]